MHFKVQIEEEKMPTLHCDVPFSGVSLVAYLPCLWIADFIFGSEIGQLLLREKVLQAL